MVSIAGNNTITLPMSYDDTSSILSNLGKPKRWRDLRPFEKMLVIIIGIVSVICLALVIAIAVVGTKLTHTAPVPVAPPEGLRNSSVSPSTVTPTTRPASTGKPSGTSTPRPTNAPPTVLSQRNDTSHYEDPDHVETAGLMLSIMDQSIDPCRDFYKYACGNWETQHPIPDSQSTWDQFDVVKEHITRELHLLLSDDLDPNDPEPVRMAQRFYANCVAQNDESNYTEFKELLEHLLQDYDHDLWRTLGHIRRILGQAYIFDLKVALDEKDATKHIIYLDQPKFGISRSHLVERNYYHDAYVQAYEALIEEAWNKIFHDKRHAEAAANVIYFERLLAENAESYEQRLNKTAMYNVYTIEELYELTDAEHVKMNWTSFFDEVFFEIHDPEVKGTSWNKTKLIVKNVHYFHMLEMAFEGNRTHQIIKDFLTWKVVLTLAKDITVEMRDLMYLYDKVVDGLQAPPPLWKICVQEAQEYFGMALAYHYVQDYFHDEHLKEVMSIVDDVKSTLKRALLGNDDLKWMSKQTRLRAIAKLDRMQAFIGHPEWLVDGEHKPNHPLLITELMEYYYHLQLDKNNQHFDNVVDLLEWKSRESLRQFPNSRDFNKWLTDPLEVVALYWPGHNAITLPAGLLQRPFFGAPLKYLNYGAVGALIGHVLIHTFDHKGKQYGPDGSLYDWWDEETETNYKDKSRCFVRGYSNYSAENDSITVTDLLIHIADIYWKQSLIDESIADSLGLKLAYKAYSAHKAREGPEPKLPGFNETADQLFFVSYAQMWCTDYRSEFGSSVRSGWYTPSQFRAFGGLHSSQDFRRAWGCPLLPSETVCHVW